MRETSFLIRHSCSHTYLPRSLPVAANPCWQPVLFPTLSLQVFPRMLEPWIPPGCRVHLPVSSPTSSAFPKSRLWVGLPESPRKETSCGGCFEIVAIPYVQASWFARHPGLPTAAPEAQGSCDFYTRADHASLPLRAIDGGRIFTS